MISYENLWLGLLLVGGIFLMVLGGWRYRRDRAGLVLFTEESLFRKGLAEGIGTFFLVFIGCGALMMHVRDSAWVSSDAVILAFGGTLMVMVSVFGSISGGHINPAVSTAFFLLGRMRRKVWECM